MIIMIELFIALYYQNQCEFLAAVNGRKVTDKSHIIIIMQDRIMVLVNNDKEKIECILLRPTPLKQKLMRDKCYDNAYCSK